MEQFFLSDAISDAAKAALGAAIIGLVFGFFSQRSKFCMRSATVEFWRGRPAGKVAIWLMAFAVSILSVQLLIAFDQLPEDNIRQLSNIGSLSGAIIGGALFGSGMILARGCAGRILVLSATGNLRTLFSGLLLTVVAQSSLRGILSPVREQLSSIWLISAEYRGLANYLPNYFGIVLGVAITIGALVMIRKFDIGWFKASAVTIIGLTIAAGWWFTAQLSAVAFDPVAIESLTFTGPSANTLMVLINEPNLPLSFGIGLVPGVFVGSFIASIVSGTFKIEKFNAETGMGRYITGAIMMGFGGMLAGGCAIGVGLTGVSVLSLTAVVALISMWVSAGITDLLVDRQTAFIRIQNLRSLFTRSVTSNG